MIMNGNKIIYINYVSGVYVSNSNQLFLFFQREYK